MALVDKQTVCIRCGEFFVTDNTGNYDVTTNTGGYGTPNPDFGDTVPYTIAFSVPKSDAIAYTLDMYADPPTPDPTTGFYEYPAITPEDVGLPPLSPITSGIWTITITFGTEVKVKKLLAFADIAQRIRSCICCNGWKKYGKLNLKLKGAKDEFACFRYAEAQTLIDELYKETENCCGCND